MKIFILSDTHRNLINTYKILDKIQSEIDVIIHLGDNVDDADMLRSKYYEKEIYNVAGNCDFGNMVPTEKLIEIGGKKIFITHGHSYNVKYGYDRLSYAAEEKNAEIALYGHTHRALLENINGITIMCPGSLSSPRGTNICSYGIINIDENGEMQSSIMGIVNGKIEKIFE